MKMISINVPKIYRIVNNPIKLLIMILIAQILLIVYPIWFVWHLIFDTLLQIYFWIIVVDCSMSFGFDRWIERLIHQFQVAAEWYNSGFQRRKLNSNKEKKDGLRSFAEWALHFPEEYREAYTSNIYLSWKSMDDLAMWREPSTVLASSFNWSKSPEGYQYWNTLVKILDGDSI